MPKPWGVTALFAEHTGNHAPVDVEWAFEQQFVVSEHRAHELVVVDKKAESVNPQVAAIDTRALHEHTSDKTASFSTFWEFALALNRADPSALALAQDGNQCQLTIDELELKKLLGTFWFRSVFARLSPTWRERVLTVLCERIVIPDHVLRVGRQDVRLGDANYAQLKELFSKTSVPDAVQADLRLLITIGNLWGQEGLDRLRFTERLPIDESPKFSGLLQGFRR